jgi:hypothetical protein
MRILESMEKQTYEEWKNQIKKFQKSIDKL